VKKIVIVILLAITAEISVAQKDSVIYFEYTDSSFSGGSVHVVRHVFYDFAKWTLRPESFSELDTIYYFLQRNPRLCVEVSNHSDYRVNPNMSVKLTQRRAVSVVDYLVSKGTDPIRLIATGYSNEKPYVVRKADCQTYDFLKAGDVLSEKFILNLNTVEKQEAANQLNRRIEIKILKN